MVNSDPCPEHCQDHSGFKVDIINLKKDCVKMGDKVDDIAGKFNTILGGLIIALLMLVVNIGLTLAKSGTP